ncbi:MAG: tetratricopeptide repeat protein [Planctomycetaceae bacterium]|nr:tetratricopeptide repeat protein [Planctomycetaceae bacterium]
MAIDSSFNVDGCTLDDCVEAYETARAEGRAALVGQFLPDRQHPDYHRIVIELLRVDLEYAWNEGRQTALEDHLRSFPDVLQDSHAISVLAYEDFRLRLQSGEQVNPDDYRRHYGADVTGWIDADEIRSLNASVDGGQRTAVTGSVEPDPDGLTEPPEIRHDTATQFQTATSPGELIDIIPGCRFLNFNVVRELGAGIHGRVFLARQTALADRYVVLKITHRGTVEAQRLASLQHSNIVPIYSVHEGGELAAICMPYLGRTMLSHWVSCLKAAPELPSCGTEFLDGLGNAFESSSEISPPTPSITTRFPDRSAPPALPETGGSEIVDVRSADGVPSASPANHVSERTLGGNRVSPFAAPADPGAQPLFGQLREGATDYTGLVLCVVHGLSEGLTHAHRSGILHRDLKPANILLTDDGQPLLLDFHLALRLDAAPEAETGVGGTIPYMSPEQLKNLAGDSAKTEDPRSDVFSLGVVLFELLTGRLPFATSTGRLGDVVQAALDARLRIPSARQHNPAVSPAVDAIVQKCLRSDPDQRYQTAGELSEDLRRQREFRPLRYAGNPSIRERLRKWFQRHPGATSVSFISVVTSLILLSTLLAWNMRERHVTALEAFETFSTVQGPMREAMAALSVPLVDPDERAEALRAGNSVLASWDVLSPQAWQQRPKYQALTDDQQSQLRHQLSDLLFLLAEAEMRAGAGDATTSAGGGDSSPPVAARLNQLAMDCFPQENVPLFLVRQRQDQGWDAAEGGASRAVPPDGLPSVSGMTTDRASQAMQLLVQGRLRPAAQILDALSREQPDSFLVWFRLGICRYGLGDYASAEQCFTTCLAISPASRQAVYRRGMARLKGDRLAEARADFDRVLQQNPGSGSALVSRGLTWMAEQKWQPAVDDLTAAIENGFSQTRVYFLRSRCYRQLGDNEHAETDRTEGLTRTPTDPLSWMARGVARLNDEPDAAIRDFRSAIQMNPRQYDAYLNIAHVYEQKLDRPSDAIAVLDESLHDENENALSWAGRAVLHARHDNPSRARADAARALELDDAPMVLYQVACAYALSMPDDELRNEAMHLLARAFAQDDSLIRLSMTDPDIKPLHSDERFRKMIAAARIMQMLSSQPSASTEQVPGTSDSSQ